MKKTAAFLVALLLGAGLAWADPPTVYTGELTWTEIRDAIQAGKTTIIVPVGGTEQSGPHIALNKHNLRVRFFAGRVAAALGNALVAPVLAYVPEGSINPPTGHMRFPGTMTIPEATFEEILVSTGRGFKAQGFKDVVFIGDHGGYQKSMKKAAASLNREWAASPVRAHAIEEYYDAVQKDYKEALRAKGFTDAEIGVHAGLADTSLMLAIDPSLVRMDAMKSAAGDKSNGVDGDPTKSTSALGKIGVDIVVKKTVDAIKRDVGRREAAPPK
jgi:creatinine amidohydrolase/Fe(II)-dependent formamide hydrolase-like protein